MCVRESEVELFCEWAAISRAIFFFLDTGSEWSKRSLIACLWPGRCLCFCGKRTHVVRCCAAQEDLDNMTKELQYWLKDKELQTQLLEEEKRESEAEVDRLHAQLQEVEDKIKEEELKIKDVKAQVLPPPPPPLPPSTHCMLSTFRGRPGRRGRV